MTSVTYTNLNRLLLIRDIQEIAKTYINDDRSYRWIWKNKIADVYHIGYVTFMNYISVPSINAKLTKLSLRRNVEYNVQLLSINVHVINHFIVISTNSNIFVVHLNVEAH